MASTLAKQNQDSTGKERLKLWLRLLQSTRLIEVELRERLRREFAMTLPRFDVLAALYRKPDGMLMSQLSHYLLVSNGNVTGIIDRLVADGMVMRRQREGDRRASIVSLTGMGKRNFKNMAAIHETWVNELMASISPKDAKNLSEVLQKINLAEPS